MASSTRTTVFKQISELSQPPMSHKAKRQLRKAVAKTAKMDPVENSSTACVEAKDNILKYECVACEDEFPLYEGAITCDAHFMCEQCILRVFELATRNTMDMFPAACCGPVSFYLSGHLLCPKTWSLYDRKIGQHSMEPSLRVLCSDCSLWQNPKGYVHDGKNAMTKYYCGNITCVDCKHEWQEGHKCTAESGRPDWLGPYTPESRVKQCPGCKVWIQLSEACNHMKCTSCNHEFCFICKMAWTGFHDIFGCPRYGDPSCGYDDYGFEIDRGIHRDTGLDRRGLNRLGKRPGKAEPPAANQMPDENLYGVHDPELAMQVAEAYLPLGPRTVDHAMSTSCPLEHLTFNRLHCQHEWALTMFQWLDVECAICNHRVDHLGCLKCGIPVCATCSFDFERRVLGYHPDAYDMVTVIQWAEDDLDSQMAFEEDFGISRMFSEFEHETLRNEWYVAESDVGVKGLTMTLRLDTNPFAPLFWDRL